jgi:hypothetical protein
MGQPSLVESTQAGHLVELYRRIECVDAAADVPRLQTSEGRVTPSLMPPPDLLQSPLWLRMVQDSLPRAHSTRAPHNHFQCRCKAMVSRRCAVCRVRPRRSWLAPLL